MKLPPHFKALLISYSVLSVLYIPRSAGSATWLRLFLMLAMLAPGSVVNPISAADRPNVLLILVDDLGYSDLGCYGGEIPTPNLDKLSQEGLRFTQFYNAGVCVLTRAALTTGLYPRQGKGGLLRRNSVTLGEVMRDAGYKTSLIGKWHLGSKPPRRPIDRGFDHYYGLLDGCCNFFNPGQPDPEFYNGGRVRDFADGETIPTSFPDDYYTTDAFSDRAIDFIKTNTTVNREPATVNTAKPFFLHLCYTAPHFPLHAREEDIARHRGKYKDGYHVLRDRRHARQRELGLFERDPKLSPVDEKTSDHSQDYEVVPWNDLDPALRAREEARMEVYAAMVDRLDQGIGRVLDALDASGVADNTLVFFLSDNGGCASWPGAAKIPAFLEHNKNIPVGDPRGYEFVGPAWGWAQNTPFRRHKTWTYEGGINTPMIVRWPGRVEAGTITREPAHIVDFMPTLLELADAKYPTNHHGQTIPPMEGTTLLPILEGKEAPARPEPMSWAVYKNRATRDGPWKLIWGADKKQWELYNLAEDRTETVDLAALHPERVVSMTATWNTWAKKCELPTD